MRLIRQDLLVELVRCKNSGLVVCIVGTEFLVYRVGEDNVASRSVRGEMVRDITAVLKRTVAVNGFTRSQPTSVHIFTNANFYDSAEHVACELGLRVFCHRFHP